MVGTIGSLVTFTPLDWAPPDTEFFSPTTISITQEYLGSHPVADAGPDLSFDSGDLVTIDASESEDRDGTITSVVWTQIDGPSVTLDTTNPLRPTFIAPSIPVGTTQTITFRMAPTDNDGKTPLTGFTYDADDDDTVSITVFGVDVTPPEIAPLADVRVEAAEGASSAIATFDAASVTDDTDPAPSVTYTLGGVPVASGDSFPLGANLITVTATDAAGNVATSSFTITVGYSAPANLALEVLPASLPAGEGRTLRYTLSLPASSDRAPDAISFLHDTAFTALGVSVDTARLPSTPCGPGSSIDPVPSSGPGFLSFTGGTLNPGESCSFDVAINVPATLAPADYTQLTGPVVTSYGATERTGPAATTQWTVTPPVPVGQEAFNITFDKNTYNAGELAKLTYRVSSIRRGFEHDLSFFAPGLEFLEVDRTDCIRSGQFGQTVAIAILNARSFLRVSNIRRPGCKLVATVSIPANHPGGAIPMLTSPLYLSDGNVIDTTTVLAPAATTSASVVPAVPPVLSMSFNPNGSAARNQTFEILLEARNPNPAAFMQNNVFEMDTAFYMPGATAELARFSGDSCRNASATNKSASNVFVSLPTLSPGQACVAHLRVTPPPALPTGIYRFASSPLTGLLNGAITVGNLVDGTYQITRSVEPQPAQLSMEIGPSEAISGVARRIRYTLRMPPNVPDPESITFQHDMAVGPGITFDTTSLRSNPCGVGSSVSFLPSFSPGFIELNDAKLRAGEECTFDLRFNVPANFAGGSYTQTTGPVSTFVDRERLQTAAASEPWTVIGPKPATMAMEVLPAAAPPGGGAQYPLHDHDARRGRHAGLDWLPARHQLSGAGRQP